MRIAWITPLSRRSAIGRVSAAATRLLKARGHELRIIRSEYRRSDPTPTHPVQVPVEWWQDVPPQEVSLTTDAVIVNLGDHYGFHAGVLAYIDTVPCLGIFHDFFLYYFFREWITHERLGERRHEREICLTYGDDASIVARQAWRNPGSLQKLVELLPMTEWLGRRCGAALTHSLFYVSRLRNSCPGPIATAPLCFEPRPIEVLPVRGNDEVVVTTIGHMNQNKCAEAVIRAIAVSPLLRRRCRYRLVGSITPRERARLTTLCHELGFERLDILGEVPETMLNAELGRADILSCLRKPVLEGASASAIEGMKAGRPILVSDVGFYSEIPDDLVFKIPPAVEPAALQQVLERLVADERLRRETGAKARDWATRTFTTEAYVNILEELIEQFVEAKPLLAVGERIGGELAALGMRHDDPAIDRLAADMHGLFGGNP